MLNVCDGRSVCFGDQQSHAVFRVSALLSSARGNEVAVRESDLACKYFCFDVLIHEYILL